MSSTKTKLFLGIPCYRDIEPHFFISLVEFMEACRDILRARSLEIGDSVIGRCRNTLVYQFMSSDCTDLLMLDTDMDFDAEAMRAMVFRDESIVAGPAFLKTTKEHVINLQPLEEGQRVTLGTGVHEVDWIGSAAMRVKREVFEDMTASGNVMSYSPNLMTGETHWDFFPMGPSEDGGLYGSEDVRFCRGARDAGHKVYADTDNLCGHWGRVRFPIQQPTKQ